LSLYRIDLGFPVFIAEYKAALKQFPTFKDDVKKILEQLEKDPNIGDQMQRVGENVFKVRLGVKGQFGKRGGYRMIYHVDHSRFVITPIALYFKPDTPSLPDREVAQRFDKLMKVILESAQQTQVPEPPARPN
jgi:mRNA-degrading endonuclease RelE of RelBE toxin-antitoxin system